MTNSAKRILNRMRSNWYVWLFPLFAVGISVWLFMDFYKQRGPDVRILFEDASSIQPEKTQVRFRGVTVGQVRNVTISEDNKDVIAHVRLHRDARHLAVEGTKFWVVVPK